MSAAKLSKAAVLRAARDWLRDVAFRADPSVVAFLRDDEVRGDVHAHYPGGWDAFDADTRREQQALPHVNDWFARQVGEQFKRIGTGE